MKRPLFVVSVLAVALAGASVYLLRQVGSERSRAQSAAARVVQLEARLKSMERKLSASLQSAATSPPATAAAAGPLPAAAAPTAKSGAANTTPGVTIRSEDNWQARMWRTPSSRALLRAERIARLKTQNPQLARELGMTEAEADDLLAFLADQELKRETMFATRRDPNVNFANVVADQKRELAEKLGEERMQKYEAYRKGAPDRSQVRQFRTRLGDSDTLTDAQADSLAAALQEEREQYAKEIKNELGSSATFTMQSMYGKSLMTTNSPSDEDAQERQLIEQMEAYNRRAHDRAAGLLTSRQMKSFEEFQAAQLVSERLMLRSMRDTDPAK
jgi:hypothetical protein